MPQTLLETGKDNLDFNTKKSAERIAGFSAVIYDDQLSYGYWNRENVLVKASLAPLPASDTEFNKLANAYKGIEKISIASASMPFLHIPKKYFSSKKAGAFFDEFYPIEKLKNRKATHEYIQNDSIVTAHYAPELLGVRNAKKLNHLSSCLSNYVQKENLGIYAMFSGNTMHLIHSSGGELQFYNQFNCNHAEDFLYFILLSYRELGLSTHHDALNITGHITKRSSITNLLKQYLKLNWVAQKDDWIRSGEHPDHFYHDLYVTHTCGS